MTHRDETMTALTVGNAEDLEVADDGLAKGVTIGDEEMEEVMVVMTTMTTKLADEAEGEVTCIDESMTVRPQTVGRSSDHCQ